MRCFKKAEMLGTEEAKREGLRPVIVDVSELIAERDKCSHHCFLSVLELFKLRLRILVIQREDIEHYSR